MAIPIHPATGKGFYPGIYFGGEFEKPTGALLQNIWDTYLKAKLGVWTRPNETFLGLVGKVGWGDFYTNQNTRPTDPLDPDDSAYNWNLLDDLLSAPFLVSGEGKLFLRLQDRYVNNAQPDWVKSAPYNGTWEACKPWDPTQCHTVVAMHRQTAIDELILFYQAVGARYSGQGRIGLVFVSEQPRLGVDPDDFNNPIGGGSGGHVGQDAHDYGTIATRKALIDAFPTTTVIMGNVRPRLATGFTGSPENKGLVDFGMGVGYPDPQPFFGTCGSGPVGSNDCDTNTGFWTMQKYRNDVPTHISAEQGGWVIQYWEGDDPWQRVNPFGYVSGNSPIISTEIHAWYFSDEPPSWAPTDDSGQGQVGRDPKGVLPVTYHNPIVKQDTGGKGDGRTWADWERAYDIFGQSGTAVVPYYPIGYPKYSDGSQNEDPVAARRVTCGVSSNYVDSAGNEWETDVSYTSETGANSTASAIVNNTVYDDALFKSFRADKDQDNIPYTFPNLKNGTWKVTLGFLETFQTAEGGRLFDIQIQGVSEVVGYDIFAAAEGQLIAVTRTVDNISVTNETMSITLIDTAADRPIISFIHLEESVVAGHVEVEEETSPGVYVNRESIREVNVSGQLTITLNDGSVLDWGNMTLKVVSQEVNEQIQGAKLKTDAT